MTATITPSTGPAPEPSEPRRRLSRKQVAARSAVLAAIALIALMWVYAFVFADHDAVAGLRDKAWTERAESICKQRNELIDENTTAFAATDGGSAALAAAVHHVTDLVEAALDEVVAVKPDNARDQQLVATWEGFYRTYITDRRNVEIRLAKGEAAELNETTLNGSPISLTIADFTNPNHMTSCSVPPGT